MKNTRYDIVRCCAVQREKMSYIKTTCVSLMKVVYAWRVGAMVEWRERSGELCLCVNMLVRNRSKCCGTGARRVKPSVKTDDI